MFNQEELKKIAEETLSKAKDTIDEAAKEIDSIDVKYLKEAAEDAASNTNCDDIENIKSEVNKINTEDLKSEMSKTAEDFA